MAKNEVRNGQAEYGVVHVMEEEMRAAGQGVFEEHSSEAAMTKAERRESRKASTASPQTKMEAAPANKSALDHDRDGKAGGSLKGSNSTRARGAAKRRTK